MEVWKDIEGYEGLYQVSSYGQVRSLDRIVNSQWGLKSSRKGRTLKWVVDKRGYAKVSLSKEGKIFPTYVHRIVAQAFIPNPFNYIVVNHIDENPLNNKVSNLEWCTTGYNLAYVLSVYKRGTWVQGFSEDGKLIADFPLIGQSEQFGFNRRGISKAIHNPSKDSWYRNLNWKILDKKEKEAKIQSHINNGTIPIPYFIGHENN